MGEESGKDKKEVTRMVRAEMSVSSQRFLSQWIKLLDPKQMSNNSTGTETVAILN